jgi:hypothetical protein
VAISGGIRTAEAGAALGRRRVHGQVPRLFTAPVRVAPGGALTSRPAVVALRIRGEATRLPAAASPLGFGDKAVAARSRGIDGQEQLVTEGLSSET